MRRWTAVAILIILILALIGGFFIEPLDSRSNLETASWFATYFSNTELEGDPALQRYERALSYNWSQDAPLGVPPDQFSARWVGRFEFEEGLWRFLAGADDGVRLWVDELLVIDQWEPSNQFINYSTDIQLEEGEHTIQVEYYDNAGLAGVTVNWHLIPPPVESTDPTPPDGNGDGQEGPLPASNAIGLVATSELEVYQGPGLQYIRIGQVFLHQKLGIVGQNAGGTWYLLDLGQGRVGWVSSDFVVRTDVNDIPVVSQISSNDFPGVTGETLRAIKLFAAPDPASEALELIPIRAQVSVLGRSGNSLWYRIRYNGLEGWSFGPAIELEEVLPSDLPTVQ
ncbi:MAG: PA14 domain-containing protein [Chloroflexi bacterium]|nr:PA14 domain-containing protein [Chloroflexota bacterium]